MNEDQKPILDRISRIEGQLRGIRTMVEQHRACHDIVKQIAAANGALRGLGLAVLEHHLEDCVDDAMQGRIGREELVRRLLDVYSRANG